MCGIVGYVGQRDAVPLLLDGLRRLEYRGYDSAGVAVIENGEISIRKSLGRLSSLDERLGEEPVSGTSGIGHTRWATHGAPSVVNSHPHTDSSGKIAVVHNGIIENYQELRAELEAVGHTFKSDTDTEVIPHLIERELANGASSFVEAVRRSLQKATGAYALGILYQDEPNTLYAARHGSPLIVGLSDDGQFIASDVPAIMKQISKVVYLDDGEVAVLNADGIEVTTVEGSPVEPDIKDIEIAADSADLAGYETFMLKEIHEQPNVLDRLLKNHLNAAGEVLLDNVDLDDAYFAQLKRIIIVSCGTAYYAGLYGKYILEHLTGIAAEIDLGSEFRYRDPKIEPGTLMISVSQSGETADTLASMRMAKENGCKLLTICNVPGSSVVRESDAVFYTNAGLEIGVASTKAYTSQCTAFVLLAVHMARLRKETTPEASSELIDQLLTVSAAISEQLERKDDIKATAEKYQHLPSALYLGRKFNYPTALEGALKTKEISYQHAEGYAAGEMKHGPIALINEDMPVVCICTRTKDEVYDKMISNIREVDARSGRIIALATDGDERMRDVAEDVIYVPECRDELSPIVNVVALQLLAYYTARARGTDIDKPRNLAKSVTVE